VLGQSPWSFDQGRSSPEAENLSAFGRPTVSVFSRILDLGGVSRVSGGGSTSSK